MATFEVKNVGGHIIPKYEILKNGKFYCEFDENVSERDANAILAFIIELHENNAIRKDWFVVAGNKDFIKVKSCDLITYSEAIKMRKAKGGRIVHKDLLNIQ